MSRWKNIQAVLFDLDGTLLDSAPDLAAAANALRIQRQLPPLPLAHYRPFVGTGARGMLRLALGIQETDPEFCDLKEAFFQAYEACMGAHSRIFPGVPEVLQGIDKNCQSWGIVTNKIERFTKPIVQADELLSKNQVLVCGDTTAFSKPHPAPLLAAASTLRVAPGACIYVGDDERDIQAAKAAGMRAIAASSGYLGDAHDVRCWQPDAIIDSPQGLLNLLDFH